jgi:hypothetical protein
MPRTHGRCARGERLRIGFPHGHRETTSFVAGLRLDGMVAPMVLDGPINGDWFEAYVAQILLPTLRRGDIVIMDNLSSHKRASVYAPDRKAERPIAHLAGFSGILQVDGYRGYRTLAEKNGVTLVAWSHVRRRFNELAAAGSAPIAGEALTRIAELYRIESDIRGRSASERRAVRQEGSKTVIAGLEPWLREKLGLVSQKTKLAEAIRYVCPFSPARRSTQPQTRKCVRSSAASQNNS